MRKPAFCICENKEADQLRGNREADQRLCFRHIDRTISTSQVRIFESLVMRKPAFVHMLYSLVCVGPGRKPRSRSEAR